MNLCQYRDIFGVPGTGVHSIRFMDIAILDLGMTLLAVYAIYKIFKLDFNVVLLYTIIIGIIMHRLFCVNTGINKIIFGVV